MIEPADNALSKQEFLVLQALERSRHTVGATSGDSFDMGKGWFTATQIAELNDIVGPNIRLALMKLVANGFAEKRSRYSIQTFRVTQKGENRIADGFQSKTPDIVVDSATWTGVIQPVQISQVSVILAEMEDVCERITNNHERSQIFGLIRAMEVLLSLPEPPRQGVVSLLRDPAFANIVQVATFLAALIAAVKP